MGYINPLRYVFSRRASAHVNPGGVSLVLQPRYWIGVFTRITTALLYVAGMWDAFDAAHSLVEGRAGWRKTALFAAWAFWLTIAMIATVVVNISSLTYTKAKEAAAREKFVNVTTTLPDPPGDVTALRGPLGVHDGFHTQARRRAMNPPVDEQS